MPIYEYDCADCGRRFSALVGVVANPKPPACPRCGSERLRKAVSPFARVRSEEEAFESLADDATFGDIENDPKAMSRWARELGSAMDEDMGGDIEQAIEEEFGGAGKGNRDDDVV